MGCSCASRSACQPWGPSGEASGTSDGLQVPISFLESGGRSQPAAASSYGNGTCSALSAACSAARKHAFLSRRNSVGESEFCSVDAAVMKRQATLGGDVSRRGTRRPGSGARARPNGLRALASSDVPSAVQEAAPPYRAAAPVGGGVHAVTAAPACQGVELANAARRLFPEGPDGVTPWSQRLPSTRASWTVVDTYERTESAASSRSGRRSATFLLAL
jgi:hypothetical protein